ncbi:unnamed protein product [Closterium sp. NIES-54]
MWFAPHVVLTACSSHRMWCSPHVFSPHVILFIHLLLHAVGLLRHLLGVFQLEVLDHELGPVEQLGARGGRAPVLPPVLVVLDLPHHALHRAPHACLHARLAYQRHHRVLPLRPHAQPPLLIHLPRPRLVPLRALALALLALIRAHVPQPLGQPSQLRPAVVVGAVHAPQVRQHGVQQRHTRQPPRLPAALPRRHADLHCLVLGARLVLPQQEVAPLRAPLRAPQPLLRVQLGHQRQRPLQVMCHARRLPCSSGDAWSRGGGGGGVVCEGGAEGGAAPPRVRGC